MCDPVCQLELRQGVPLGLAARRAPFSGPGKEYQGCAMSPAVKSCHIICKAIDPLWDLGEGRPECVHPKTCCIFGNKISQCFCRSGTVLPQTLQMQRGRKMAKWIQLLKQESTKGHATELEKKVGKNQQNLLLSPYMLPKV